MNTNDPKVKEAIAKSIQELMVMPTEEFKRRMKEASQGIDSLYGTPFDDEEGCVSVFSAEFLRET